MRKLGHRGLSVVLLATCLHVSSAASAQVTCAPVPPRITRFVHSYRAPEAPWEKALFQMSKGNPVEYMKAVRTVEDVKLIWSFKKIVEPGFRAEGGDVAGAVEGLLDTPDNVKGMLEQADVVGKLGPIASTPADASFVTTQAAEGGTSLPYRIEYFQQGPNGELYSLDRYVDYCGSVIQRQGRLSDLTKPPAGARTAKRRTMSLTPLLLGGGVAVGAAVVLSGRDGGSEAENAQPCNATTRSGGYGVTTTVHELGKKSGTFGFEWNAFSIPDRFTATYENRTLFDSGVVSGIGQKSITYSGKSRQVTVTVRGDQTGTQWNYVVRCP